MPTSTKFYGLPLKGYIQQVPNGPVVQCHGYFDFKYDKWILKWVQKNDYYQYLKLGHYKHHTIKRISIEEYPDVCFEILLSEDRTLRFLIGLNRVEEVKKYWIKLRLFLSKTEMIVTLLGILISVILFFLQ